MASHALGFVAEEDSVLLVEPNLVVLQKIVRILVSNRDAEPPVVLQKVFLKQPVPDAPTQIQSILTIAPGDTFADHRPLRTAARMEAQTGVVFAHAALNEDIVGLLEADAVAVVVPHDAILNNGAEAAIEKNAGASTAVEIDIFILVPFDDQVFHTRAFEVVAADDRENCRGLGLVGRHAIGIERRVDGKRVAAAPGNAGHRGVKSARVAVPDRHAVTDLEAVGMDQGNLFFAVIAIQRQQRRGRFGFAENGLAFGSLHSDEGTEMQRIVHDKFACANFDGASAQARDVIHGRLQGAIVGADYVRVAQTDRNDGALFHFGMHRARELLFIGARGEFLFLVRCSEK